MKKLTINLNQVRKRCDFWHSL